MVIKSSYGKAYLGARTQVGFYISTLKALKERHLIMRNYIATGCNTIKSVRSVRSVGVLKTFNLYPLPP